MAVSLNSVMTGGNNGDTHAVNGATSISTTGITVAAGTNSVLVAVFNWMASAGGSTHVSGITGVTWNGVAFTTSLLINDGAGNFDSLTAAIYVWVAPATGAKTLAISSWTGNFDCYCSAVCFDGADQTTGIDIANNVTDATNALTLNVTGTSDGATVATHIRNGGQPTGAGTGNTLFWDFDSFNPGGCGGYRIGLNGTNTFDFNSGTTGTHRCTAGVNVIAASGGGGGGAVLRKNSLLRVGVGR